MLTAAQKATILRKAGIPLPPAPDSTASIAPGEATAQAEAARADAADAWAATVNVAFVTYAAARAAKSLRDAEEARQMHMLRQLSAGLSRNVRASHRT